MRTERANPSIDWMNVMSYAMPGVAILTLAVSFGTLFKKVKSPVWDASPAALERRSAMVTPSDLHESHLPSANPEASSSLTEVLAPAESSSQSSEEKAAESPNAETHSDSTPANEGVGIETAAIPEVRDLRWLPETQSIANPIASSPQALSLPPPANPPKGKDSTGSAPGMNSSIDAGIFGSCSNSGGTVSVSQGIQEAGRSTLSQLAFYQNFTSASSSIAVSDDSLVAFGGAGTNDRVFETDFHLADSSQAGTYEWIIYSDMRVSFDVKTSPDHYERMIDADPRGQTQMLCGNSWTQLAETTWAPLKLTLRQSPTQGIGVRGQTLILFYRKISQSDAGRSRDSLCGQNVALLNSQNQLTTSATEFLRRGWRVAEAQNFFMPGTYRSVECATPQISGLWNVSGSIQGSGPALGSTDLKPIRCSRGLKSYAFGKDVFFDFGTGECSGEGWSSVTACAVRASTENEAIRLTEKLFQNGGQGEFRVQAASSSNGCISIGTYDLR